MGKRLQDRQVRNAFLPRCQNTAGGVALGGNRAICVLVWQHLRTEAYIRVLG